SARRGPSLKKVNNPCWSFAKGSCRFGDTCKYLHNGVHDKSTLLSRTSGSASSTPDVTRSDLDMLQSLLAKFGLNAPNTFTPSPPVAYTVSVPPGFPSGGLVSNGVTAAGGLLSTSGGSDAFWSTAGVGDGRFIPVTNYGHSVLSTPFRPLCLNNVLITPNIVKNLISVRQFVRDNSCTVKKLGKPKRHFLKYGAAHEEATHSTGDLYPVTKPSIIPHAFLSSQYTWHQRLGHPGKYLSLRRCTRVT
nr:ribonuclease H-like domain-containing protein [Tanacetum cinerariifolium]